MVHRVLQAPRERLAKTHQAMVVAVVIKAQQARARQVALVLQACKAAIAQALQVLKAPAAVKVQLAAPVHKVLQACKAAVVKALVVVNPVAYKVNCNKYLACYSSY